MKFSSFIRKNLDAIVAEWETFARTLVPAQHMTALALRDHCREILLGVADDMEVQETIKERAAKSKGLAESPDLAATAATSHGALRQLSGFDLVQLVAEFRALRASVLALWQRYVGPGAETAAFEENLRFNEAIDKALAESVKSYSSNVDSSRDMFLAILGHDLRGPLSGINLSNALLGRPDLPETTRQAAVTRIKRASLEMSRLITDLLEYTRSRLGAGIPIERSACDLGLICEEALESIRTSHPEQIFKFQAGGDLTLEADAARLQQVLSNLLENAVQHGDPQAAVSLQAEGEEEAVLVNVCNSGRPIAPGALASIFEPLIQGPAGGSPESDERSKTSLGLGLFIVREIVRGHDGTVTVQSAAETGTVFTIRLPRAPR
ncbi:MAG TPA: HAMP domain-containing sensor histidine kinase [Candidatus Dormibacteraeota bacterium]|nr:HAMP domain-containing sensor histidine kinase [Candidatus Dormibacteraeota bacterium]